MANLATQAYLQAQKDIREELAKEGKVYIDCSLKALRKFDTAALDFFISTFWYGSAYRGANGRYTKLSRR